MILFSNQLPLSVCMCVYVCVQAHGRKFVLSILYRHLYGRERDKERLILRPCLGNLVKKAVMIKWCDFWVKSSVEWMWHRSLAGRPGWVAAMAVLPSITWCFLQIWAFCFFFSFFFSEKLVFFFTILQFTDGNFTIWNGLKK